VEPKRSQPSVTVIIPTYNWSTVLPFSIGSALRQTFTDFEVLVVGDGCTDDSQAVVESIQDDRVRWINLPSNSRHQSAPNNEGLKQARGQLVAYLGHDDLWLPHHLQCLTEAIASGSDLAYGIVGLINLDGSSVPFPSPLNYERGTWIPPTGVVHRRQITETIGGWRNYRELTVGPELDLWQRAYDANYRLNLIPRLTAIKFPAAERRDVYKRRSCVEQANWTQRIINEPDFEIAELMNMLLPILEEKRLLQKHVQYKELVRQFVSQTCKRALGRLSYSSASSSRPKGKGEEIDEIREFKGLV
jgi:glycosyltransferase involved in cell wall biosynthesis